MCVRLPWSSYSRWSHQRSLSAEATPAVNGVSKDVSAASQPAPGEAQSMPRTAPPPGIIPISVVRSGSNSESQAVLAAAGPPPNLSRSPLPQQVQQPATIASAAASSSRLEGTEAAQPQTATSGSYALGPADGVHQQQQPPVGQQVPRPIGMPAQARPPTAAPGSQIRSNLPGSLGDLVSSFEAVKQKGDVHLPCQLLASGFLTPHPCSCSANDESGSDAQDS